MNSSARPTGRDSIWARSARAASTRNRQRSARLAALRDALQRRDLAAVDLFDELAPDLITAWGAAATQALGQTITDLKFDAALTTLESLTPSRGCD